MNDLLPPNATSEERDISLSTARVGEVPTELRKLWNPETCPANILPWLAWAFSVDTWDSNWPEFRKRAVVAQSLTTHRRKGTAGAVKGALSAFGATVNMVEWFEKSPTGTPHTFDIYIVSNETSFEAQALMAQEIDRTKPLRSHYDIIYGIASEGSINVVGVLRPAVFVRLDGGATY
jgi:phage tail P2-like protein